MKKFVVLALSAAVLLTGCEAYNNTNKAQRGAVIGAAGGALLGAILGNNVGNGQNSELGAVLGNSFRITTADTILSTRVVVQQDKETSFLLYKK